MCKVSYTDIKVSVTCGESDLQLGLPEKFSFAFYTSGANSNVWKKGFIWLKKSALSKTEKKI